MSRRERTRLIAGVAAETMPRQHVALIVEACAAASRSEDEFIRRVRREGLMIDPFFRRGAGKDDFRNPNQVTGYRITWRSADGWVERIGAKDLSDGLRLKALRKAWMSDLKALKCSKIKEVRGLGFLIGVEMDSEATAAAVKKYMFDHNILVNVAHGKTLRLMPPLIFTMEQKDAFMNVFKDAIKQ